MPALHHRAVDKEAAPDRMAQSSNSIRAPVLVAMSYDVSPARHEAASGIDIPKILGLQFLGFYTDP